MSTVRDRPQALIDLAECEPAVFALLCNPDWVHVDACVPDPDARKCETWRLLTRAIASVLMRHRRMLERAYGLSHTTPVVTEADLAAVSAALRTAYFGDREQRADLHLRVLAPSLGLRVRGQTGWIGPMLGALRDVPDCERPHVAIEAPVRLLAITFAEAWNETFARQLRSGAL